MNSSNDVASFSVSWVVDVFNHGEDVHASSFKNSTYGENLKKGKDGVVWQSRSFLMVSCWTWVEETKPVKHVLHARFHCCVDVWPHHAVRLGANLHGCGQKTRCSWEMLHSALENYLWKNLPNPCFPTESREYDSLLATSKWMYLIGTSGICSWNSNILISSLRPHIGADLLLGL